MSGTVSWGAFLKTGIWLFHPCRPKPNKCFPIIHTFDVGMRHGTISVLSEGHTVELTTFRMDGVCSDARHPDSVRFQLAEEDLSAGVSPLTLWRTGKTAG